MQKIVDYELISVNDVKLYICGGWQPLGGPVVCGRTEEIRQAMVRYEVSKGRSMVAPGIPNTLYCSNRMGEE